jgi:hypothetical protein
MITPGAVASAEINVAVSLINVCPKTPAGIGRLAALQCGQGSGDTKPPVLWHDHNRA